MSLTCFGARAAAGVVACLLAASPLSAQCTDADADGFFNLPGCGTAVDCNDTAAAVHPGATEVCDILDNDCNDVIDDSTVCVCEAGAIVDPVKGIAIATPRVKMAWSGTLFGIVWWDGYSDSDVYFLRLGPDGVPIGSTIKIADGPSLSRDPEVVWAGSEFGVTWTDNRDGNWELYLTRVGADGAEIDSEVRLTNAPRDSWSQSMVWDGSYYNVAWADHRDGSPEIYFARFTKSGARVGEEIRVTDAPGNRFYIDVETNGRTFGVAWMDLRSGRWQPYFAEVDPAGQIVGPSVQIGSQGMWWAPSLAWTGTEYGVAWATYLEGIRFRRISASGAPQAPEIPVTNGDDNAPDLVWTGSTYGLTWSSYPENPLRFSVLDAKGESVGYKVELPPENLYSSIEWTGLSYGVAFGAMHDTIRFAEITCPVPVEAASVASGVSRRAVGRALGATVGRRAID